jgi:hypothetical protein
MPLESNTVGGVKVENKAKVVLLADRSTPNTGEWQDRHDSAVIGAQHKPFESPVVNLLKEWAQYAEDHRKRYEAPIGEDGVMGQYWTDLGHAIRHLLDGETGRLDCGTLFHFIYETMRENGVDPEES